MAVVFMDGFDHYEVDNGRVSTSEFIANGWTSGVQMDGTIPSTRFEDNRHGRMARGTSTGEHRLVKSGLTPQAKGVWGVAVYEFGSLGDFYDDWSEKFQFNTTTPSDNRRIAVAFNSAGNVAIFNDTESMSSGNYEAVSTNVVNLYTWYYFEVVVDMGLTGTADGSCSVYVDGDLWVSASSITTGSTTFDSIRMNMGGDGYRDDFYLTNDNTKLDAPRIITLYPDDEGSSTNNWNGTYRDVETKGGWDGFACSVDSQYISSSTPGQIESFKYNELPPLNWTVHAVRPCFRMVNTGTGTPTVEIKCSTGATQTGITVQNDYNTPDHVESFKDAGGTQSWTTADINSLEMSVEYE